MQTTKFKTVDEYIAGFPPKTKAILKQLRKTIKETAPNAKELISYNMPAFKLNGPLVYYAAYANHIGFYPMPSSIRFFADELAKYTTSKGAIQFPMDQPLPLKLVSRIVKFRMKENAEKHRSKR
jgi:uncharacterized protein YdhG (YjbR/CyaY superfamily)